jgi:hypothetical protein
LAVHLLLSSEPTIFFRLLRATSQLSSASKVGHLFRVRTWSWFATSEWFLKEQPKQLAGLSARSSNASDTRQDREGTIAAVAKFSELDKALSTRMYDDLVGTFTKAGYVDEQTQKNDLAIVAEVADVAEIIPPRRAYDCSFARDADQQLNKHATSAPGTRTVPSFFRR